MLNDIIGKLQKVNNKFVPQHITGRKTVDYRLWRQSVFQRDNFKCQICGKKKVRLNAHHILGFSAYRHLQTETKNGITLCNRCHRRFHEVYGKNGFPDIRIVWELWSDKKNQKKLYD